MMFGTEGHGPFVADLSAERAGLGMEDVVGMGWPSPTDQAGSAGHVFQMRGVSGPVWLGIWGDQFSRRRFGRTLLAQHRQAPLVDLIEYLAVVPPGAGGQMWLLDL